MSAWAKDFLKWSRTLHIYISLLGLALFLFFAVTGIQLTHESFGLDEATASETSFSITPAAAKAAQREQIIAALPVRLTVERFEVREDEIEVTLLHPGQRAQARIDRKTGKGEMHLEKRGWVGAIADLHKGAATGWVWRAVMDITCVWIILSALTGLFMIFGLPKRKAWGLISVAVGTIVAIFAYALIPVG